MTAFILMVAVIGVVLLAASDARCRRAAVRGPRKREPIVRRGNRSGADRPMNAPTEAYVAVSAVLFFIGIVGVIARRNPLIQLMSIELLFNSANLAFVAFARTWGANAGHIFAFLVITVAAAEAAIGLAIVVVVFRNAKNVDVDEVATLKG